MEIYGSVKLKGTLADGTGDELITKDASTDELGTAANALGTLDSAKIFVGNASNIPTGVAVSGDISIDNTGVTAIASGVIVNADINATAAISVSKLASLTASRAVVTDASGFISASSVTSTALGYVANLSSDAQTQINSKQATITGGATTIVSSDLTVNRALISSGTGKVAVSSVTSTELGYISGLTSSAQTQINTKLSATISSVAQGDIIYYNGTNWVNLARGSNGQALYSTATSIQWDTPTINGIPIGGTTSQVLAKQSATDFDADWETLSVSSISDLTATAAELNVLDGITATVTELNYTDGVTSSIQTQLDSKQSSTLPQNAIWVGNSSNVASALSGGTNGYVLTSVSGVPTWQPVSASGTPPGSDTQVIFNDAGAFGADAGMVFNKTTDTLTIGTARFFSFNKVADDLFIGESAGNYTTTGTGANLGVGYLAGSALTLGNSNSFFGWSSGKAVTSGVGNVLIGMAAGQNITTGGYNIVLGRGATNNITTGSGNIAIGDQIQLSSATNNYQMSIQNAIYGASNAGTGVTMSEGNLGFYSNSWGTGAERVLSIGNALTEPSTSIADGIQLYAVDSSDATSTLALYTEQAVEAIGTFTGSHKLKVKINGTEYWIQLDAVV